MGTANCPGEGAKTPFISLCAGIAWMINVSISIRRPRYHCGLTVGAAWVPQLLGYQCCLGTNSGFTFNLALLWSLRKRQEPWWCHTRVSNLTFPPLSFLSFSSFFSFFLFHFPSLLSFLLEFFTEPAYPIPGSALKWLGLVFYLSPCEGFVSQFRRKLKTATTAKATYKWNHSNGTKY